MATPDDAPPSASQNDPSGVPPGAPPSTDDPRVLEQAIEEHRKTGEGHLGEWLLGPPNRFSPSRRGGDVLVIGLLSLVCLLPVGPLAMVRAVRCNDQRREAGLPASRLATAGMILGALGTVAFLGMLWIVLDAAR